MCVTFLQYKEAGYFTSAATNRYKGKAGHLCRGCNLVLMGGWYLRMAVEACMSSCTRPERPRRPYWQLQWVGRIRPELCGLVKPKMQLKAGPNIQPQGRGFESRLCHTELTSGKNGVGQHWWGTCPGYMPQWLGETCCVCEACLGSMSSHSPTAKSNKQP